MKSFIRDLPHYLSLFVILLAGFTGLVLFAYDKHTQTGIALAVTLAYVAWGITHHYLHKDLHLETVFEYLGVAFLGFVIIFSVIMRT